jgi:hypothetical protein
MWSNSKRLNLQFHPRNLLQSKTSKHQGTMSIFVQWLLTANLLLATVSTVILGSEYHRIHDHILLSDGSPIPLLSNTRRIKRGACSARRSNEIKFLNYEELNTKFRDFSRYVKLCRWSSFVIIILTCTNWYIFAQIYNLMKGSQCILIIHDGQWVQNIHIAQDASGIVSVQIPLSWFQLTHAVAHL